MIIIIYIFKSSIFIFQIINFIMTNQIYKGPILNFLKRKVKSNDDSIFEATKAKKYEHGESRQLTCPNVTNKINNKLSNINSIKFNTQTIKNTNFREYIFNTGVKKISQPKLNVKNKSNKYNCSQAETIIKKGTDTLIANAKKYYMKYSSKIESKNDEFKFSRNKKLLVDTNNNFKSYKKLTLNNKNKINNNSNNNNPSRINLLNSLEYFTRTNIKFNTYSYNLKDNQINACYPSLNSNSNKYLHIKNTNLDKKNISPICIIDEGDNFSNNESSKIEKNRNVKAAKQNFENPNNEFDLFLKGKTSSSDCFTNETDDDDNDNNEFLISNKKSLRMKLYKNFIKGYSKNSPRAIFNNNNYNTDNN